MNDARLPERFERGMSFLRLILRQDEVDAQREFPGRTRIVVISHTHGDHFRIRHDHAEFYSTISFGPMRELAETRVTKAVRALLVIITVYGVKRLDSTITLASLLPLSVV